MEFAVRVNPKDNKSKTFKEFIWKFDNGKGDEFVEHKRKQDIIVNGAAITEPINQHHLCHQTHQGQAQRDLQTKFDEIMNGRAAGHEDDPLTAAELIECRNHVARSVFKKNALREQLLWMRRHMHLPVGMTARTFVNGVQDVNGKLKELPPDFKDSQKFSDDELVDVVENALPNRHKKELIRQGFEVASSSLKTLIEEAKRIEAAEAMDSKPKAKPSTQKHDAQEHENCKSADWEDAQPKKKPKQQSAIQMSLQQRTWQL